MMMPMHALAEANTNIALVKYWGKNDPELNLPAVPSLSLTLEGLGSIRGQQPIPQPGKHPAGG